MLGSKVKGNSEPTENLAGAKTTDKCENPIEALGHLSVDPSIAVFYAAVRNTS